MSRQPNLGWIFYRKAFEPVGNHSLKEWYTNKHSVKEIGEEISRQDHSSYEEMKLTLEVLTASPPFIDLETIYPGLLIGAGYNHEVNFEEEFKLGFYFDHTTGLPVIPGSSVKGALRSVFPNASKNKNGKKERTGFLNWMLEETKIDIDSIDLEALEYDIFEGKHRNPETSQFEYDTSIYNRDIFYDAYVIKSNHPKIANTNNPFLGNDFITPHKNSVLDPFSDPTPLQFLKVLPGVIFRFQFKLQPFKEGENVLMSAEQKCLLFRQILLTIGIGAKTNVGYGQFRPDKDSGQP